MSYLQNKSFSVDEIVKIIVACLLHRIALMLEVRYFLSSKVKKKEDEESG